ncbi:MAG: DUF6544 family protein [Pseudomonadota bacterium]
MTMTTEDKSPQEDASPPLANFVVPSYTPSNPRDKFAFLKWVVIGVITCFATALVLSLWGHSRWVHGINTRLQALEAATPKTHPQRYDDEELKNLPPVVRRYLSQALNMYQPIVRGLYMEQSGTVNLSMQTEQWEPFTARQRVATKRPGFVWDASIATPYGISMRVVDAYVAGVGSLQPSLMGLLDVGGSHGTGDIARGELIRHFAESVWYPTALLPSQGVLWKAVDAQTAQATLTDGPQTVTLLFTFNADGLVERISSAERSALVNGVMVPIPWEVRLSSYQRHSGMLVPQEAEVAWLAPSGRMPYWRGKLEKLDYDMPR